MFRKCWQGLRHQAFAVLFGIVLISSLSVSALAAASDLGIDITVTPDKAYDRYYRLRSYDSSWVTDSYFNVPSLASLSTSFITSSVDQQLYQYLAYVPISSDFLYFVVDNPVVRVNGSLYNIGSWSRVSRFNCSFVNISNHPNDGGWNWTVLKTFDSSSDYYNPRLGRFVIPASEIPSDCNGISFIFYFNGVTDSELEVFVDQSFAFSIVSSFDGSGSGSLPEGTITEDYLDAALSIQSQSIVSDISSSIDSAVSDNQDWLDDQYSSAVGDLPDDITQTDSILDNLDEQENEYHADAVNKFNQLSSTFQGFDGSVSSGISLASTLFSRVWNSMGDYVIVYTFPLLLGLALVIIGRVSRVHLPNSGDRTKGKDES